MLTLGGKKIKCGEAYLKAGGERVVTVERNSIRRILAGRRARSLNEEYRASVTVQPGLLEEALEAVQEGEYDTYYLDMMSNWCGSTERTIRLALRKVKGKTVFAFTLVPRERLYQASDETQKLANYSQEYFTKHRLDIIKQRIRQMCGLDGIRITHEPIAEYYAGRIVNGRNRSKKRFPMMFFLFRLVK